MGAVQSVTFTNYAVVSGTITLTANAVVVTSQQYPYGDPSLFTYLLDAGGNIIDPAPPTTQNPASGEYTSDFTLTLTFSALDYPDLYVNERASTYYVTYNGQYVGQGTYTYYSTPPTLQFASFTVILYQLDNTIVRANFTYTYSGFTPNTDYFEYYLNETLIDRSKDVTFNITQSAGSGSGFADFSRVDSDIISFFLQASTQTHLIRYQGGGIGPFDTSTITTKFTVSDSNNIILQNPVTIVTISAYKSIILPPVATKKGILYHFKILTATAPYTFRIVPYFSVSPPIPPLLTSLYNSLTFDSVIEGVAGPLTMNSTRNTLTLVSDGTSWWILNRYPGTITPNSAASLPSPAVTETNETTSFNYNYVNLENDNSIILNSMSYSYLKYIFITNAYESSVTFSIYFPSGSGLETLASGDGNTYKYLSFSLASGTVGGLILTYSNSRYYIIGSSINASITSITPSIETPLTISSSISRLTTGTYFELPFVSNITSSIAVLTIIKAGTGTKEVKAATNVLFQIAQQTNTAFSLPTNSTVWFIVIKVSTSQYYLPVSYYVPPV
jgi:hypothetical protein